MDKEKLKEMMSGMPVREKLRMARKYRRMSQGKLGVLIGRYQRFICDIETGKRELDLDSLGKICEILDLSQEFFSPENPSQSQIDISGNADASEVAEQERRSPSSFEYQAPPLQEDEVFRREMRDQIEMVLQTLRSIERKILAMRFGFYGHEAHTQAEVALTLGVSKQRISQIEKGAFGKLRGPWRGRILSDIWGKGIN